MYLKPYKDHNQCFKWWALLSISKGNFTFPKIYSHHQCIVSNVNPFSQKFMKYCLNITHHVCKTGSRRLKLLNVSAITATTAIPRCDRQYSIPLDQRQRRAYNSSLHWDEFTQIPAVAQWWGI